MPQICVSLLVNDSVQCTELRHFSGKEWHEHAKSPKLQDISVKRDRALGSAPFISTEFLKVKEPAFK